MSLVLDTGAMKYRESPTDPWRPLVIKAGMNWESMADTYDPDNGTYEVGQYVLEDGMMYRCIYEIATPEAWTPAHWTSVNVGDELSSFIIISDDQPTEDSNKIWIAETTSPFGVQIPTMDDHNALGNTLNQLDQNMAYVESGNIASRTYAAGDFISWKGTLYKANGQIQSGATFSTGTGGNLSLIAGNGGGLNALNKTNMFIGPAIFSSSVDLSTVGMNYYDWDALNSPTQVSGFTFIMWILYGNTYRFAPLGYGGTRVTYYVNTTFSTGGNITAYPIYRKE